MINTTFCGLSQHKTLIWRGDVAQKKIRSTDSISIKEHILTLQSKYWKNGYVFANIDSVLEVNDTMYAYMFVGKKYKWGNISIDSSQQDWLKGVGKFGRVVRMNKIINGATQVVHEYAQHGYPFANINIQHLVEQEGKVNAHIRINSGIKVYFDTLWVSGEPTVKKKSLLKVLRYKNGGLYNEQYITHLKYIARYYPFLKLSKDPEIYFSEDKAIVRVTLKPASASRFDAIVGILPSNVPNKRLLLTGDVLLDLMNISGTARNAFFEWKKPSALSQHLKVYIEEPSVARSKIDVLAYFSLFKQDTSFITLDRKLAFRHVLGKPGAISFEWQYRTSRTISDSATNPNGSIRDFNFTQYGVRYELTSTDDLYAPRKGIKLSNLIGVGDKKTFPSGELKQASTLQTNISTEASYYQPLSRPTVLLLRIQTAWLYNSKGLFVNDLFRVGGIKTLRGHNEWAFFTPGYAISTIEWRIFFEKQGYFQIFYDHALLSNNSLKNKSYTWPYGLGVGLSFPSKNSFFQLAYALGGTAFQPPSFTRANVHVGLITKF